MTAIRRNSEMQLFFLLTVHEYPHKWDMTAIINLNQPERGPHGPRTCSRYYKNGRNKYFFPVKFEFVRNFVAFLFKKNDNLILWAVFELEIKNEANISGSVRTPKNCVVVLQHYAHLVRIGCNNQYVWLILYDAPTCSEYNSEKIFQISWCIGCSASFFYST